MIGVPGQRRAHRVLAVAPVERDFVPDGRQAVDFQMRVGGQQRVAGRAARGLTAQALLPASRGKSASSSSASSESRLAMRISRSGSKSMPSKIRMEQLAEPLVVDAELDQLHQQPLVFLLADREAGEAQQVADQQHRLRVPRPRLKAGDPHRQRPAGVVQAVVHALAIEFELRERRCRGGS